METQVVFIQLLSHKLIYPVINTNNYPEQSLTSKAKRGFIFFFFPIQTFPTQVDIA